MDYTNRPVKETIICVNSYSNPDNNYIGEVILHDSIAKAFRTKYHTISFSNSRDSLYLRNIQRCCDGDMYNTLNSTWEYHNIT